MKLYAAKKPIVPVNSQNVNTIKPAKGVKWDSLIIYILKGKAFPVITCVAQIKQRRYEFCNL